LRIKVKLCNPGGKGFVFIFKRRLSKRILLENRRAAARENQAGSDLHAITCTEQLLMEIHNLTEGSKLSAIIAGDN
jgi:hypothetical protein